MIKNIVFDFGGVLVDFNPKRMLNDNFLPEYHDIISKNVFQSIHWKNMDRGTESVDEAIHNMLPDIPFETRNKMREIILDREGQMPPIAEMTPIIEALYKGGYRLFVLSNCATWFHEFKKNIPAVECFEGFFISADYKLLKPERKIYETFLNEFNLSAEECLFIDDSPANIEAAEKIGFRTFLFDTRDFDGLKELIGTLQEE
ncbi:MAG: HAD family phosphatase [Clostridia bacterium]|nr:HAD family phosphatase [Clostridia bacterium]